MHTKFGKDLFKLFSTIEEVLVISNKNTKAD